MAEKVRKARKKAGLIVIPVEKIKKQVRRPVRLAVEEKVRSALNIPLAVPLLEHVVKRVRANPGARSPKRRRLTKPQANTSMG